MQGRGFADERAARQEICDIAADIWTRGLGAAADGNLSVRVGEDRLLTTPSACHKGRLKPRDIVLCDLRGNPLGRGRPSSELLLHLEAYRRRPEIRAVIHAHPPMATAFNLAGGKLSEVWVSEVIFAFGQVASVPYTTPTTADVPAALGPYFACYDAVMMARHGSVTLGDSLQQAFIRLDAMEHTAKVMVTARLLGGAAALPAAEVERLYHAAGKDGALPYRQAGAACPPLEPAGQDPNDAALVSAVVAAIKGQPHG